MKACMGLINELADEYLTMGGDPNGDEQIADFARACEISGLEVDPGELKDAIQKMVEQA